ncbi:MAG: NUDIX domain-containing protein [Proteobacteria bacterium]|nr:NUDIX domain-containing protein [Pseudomonadota bacterium]
MKFCSACGATVDYKVPEDDTRERAVCNNCGAIHYQNPKIVAGTLPIWGDQVLLCKRAIEPRRGYWTLPAGFMENGETAADGGARATMEEANAEVANAKLYTVFSLPHISQVYMFFKADLLGPTFSSGSESLDVALFREQDIPWDELAFPVINATLKHYFADRAAQSFPVHYENLEFRRRSA